MTDTSEVKTKSGCVGAAILGLIVVAFLTMCGDDTPEPSSQVGQYEQRIDEAKALMGGTLRDWASGHEDARDLASRTFAYTLLNNGGDMDDPTVTTWGNEIRTCLDAAVPETPDAPAITVSEAAAVCWTLMQ